MEQQQHPHRLHGPLTRTISQPAQRHQQILQQQQQQQQQQPVASLVTIIESLGSMNLHRKLERTQSEPLPQQPMNTSRYKTELCRPFEEAGECKYGEKCQFAHGFHELRNLQRHPKYKTEYCRTFHSVGFCPYGPRCHFVHNADEARAQQQAAQAAAKSSSSQQQQQQQQSQSQQQSSTAGQQSFPTKGSQATNILNSSNAANNSNQFFLPLSPPLSMSTGSDRESPTGSLSLSPTNSLTNFPFHDALHQNGGYLGLMGQGGGSGGGGSGGAGNSSSASSTSSSSGLGLGLGMGMGGIGGMGMGMGLSLGMVGGGPNTPPESPNVPISPVHTPPPYDLSGPTGKQLLQKSVSTPPQHHQQQVQPMQQEETPRLPVFNRLSSAVEAYQSNLGL
ncbi:hypothetical protein KR074_005463 [Drosophila pseudoananassae]|nr:hypothetical protein KR074_005463 [Drosophila pseudoananassae]